MHYRLLVTVNKENDQTSSEIRQLVFDQLSSDPTFVGEGGRFASPVADWFVIGGRWSGDITLNVLDQKKLKKVNKEFEEKYGWFTNMNISETDRRNQYTGIFMQHFPDYKGEIPAWRDTYKEFGFEDDAQLVNEKIYRALLKPFEGQSKGVDKKEYENHTWEELHFIDMDYDNVDKSFIGKKWLVVVDYHS